MPAGYLSGVDVNVSVLGQSQTASDWKITYTDKLQDQRSGESGGFPRRTTGQKDAKLTFKGPWTTFTSPLSLDVEYVFSCEIDPSNVVLFTGAVSSMSPGGNIETGPSIEFEVEATEDFDIVLIALVD